MKTNSLSLGLLVCIYIFYSVHLKAQDLVQTFKTKEGFTYKLPSRWKQIDSQILESYIREMGTKMPNAQLPLPSDGFEPDSIQNGIGYPNIMILPTVMTKNIGAITSEDLKRLASKARERLQKKLNSKLQDNSMDVTANVKDVSYDETGQFVRTVTAGELPDLGTIHSVSILFGTKDGMLTFQFNSKESDYGQYADLFSKIIASIERPQFLRTTETAGTTSIAPVPPSVDSKEAEGNKIDAVANWIGRLAIPAIIIAIISYQKSKKTKNDHKNKDARNKNFQKE